MVWPWSPWLGAPGGGPPRRAASRGGGASPAARRGACGEPGLEPDLAEPQVVVGLELHGRAGQEGDALAAGVLEQVARQLAPQLGLVALELLTVRRREPHDVLVGRVGARERAHLVLLHLAGELAGDLDGAHLGLE